MAHNGFPELSFRNNLFSKHGTTVERTRHHYYRFFSDHLNVFEERHPIHGERNRRHGIVPTYCEAYKSGLLFPYSPEQAAAQATGQRLRQEFSKAHLQLPASTISSTSASNREHALDPVNSTYG